MAEDIRIELSTGSPDPDRLQALRRLAERSQAADGAPPFSEQTLVELGREHPDPRQAPLTTACAFSGQQLIGAAAVIHQHHDGAEQTLTELTVDPQHRRRGVATQLASKLAESVLRTREGVTHRAWAHGGHAGGPRLAEAFSWAPVRELWRMRLANDVQLPEAELDSGVVLRSFRPGADEQAWLRANAEAFRDHPEQGQLTLDDLQARMAEDWFDASGFLLAWSQDRDAESAAELLGFHWTKTHPPQQGEGRGLGEVYAVGVVPAAQGRGLGASLTLAGIEYLRCQGVEAVILYVDAGNTAAAQLYKKLGFQVWDIDVQYAPATEAHPGAESEAA